MQVHVLVSALPHWYHEPGNALCPSPTGLPVGETGYGCHTFYITDVFRNIVIIADIRLLLCLNIVSCAHINMQFVIFTS